MFAPRRPPSVLPLLAEAARPRRVDGWALELAVERADIAKAILYVADKRSDELLPLPCFEGNVSELRSAIALAYLSGRIEFDELVDWAEEAGFEWTQTEALIRHCAEAGHGVSAAGEAA